MASSLVSDLPNISILWVSDLPKLLTINRPREHNMFRILSLLVSIMWLLAGAIPAGAAIFIVASSVG